jgi:uncharacterized membrane protein YebE (DUF533 family)
MPATDGGPAFPTKMPPLLNVNDTGVSIACDQGEQPGMSLRDWFAGQALVGLMASHRESRDALMDLSEETGLNAGALLAKLAYDNADCMLIERKKNHDTQTD